jgi:hypothetical protein
VSELQVIKNYYGRVVSADFAHLKEIGDDELRVKAVAVRGCHGNTQNLLFFSFTVEDGHVRGLKYECRYCDVTMYVTAELVSELVDQQPVERLGAIGTADIVEALGGESKKVIRQARTALRLLGESVEQLS